MTPGTGQSRIVIVGPPRAGTTLLASLLAQLGVNFGMETRSWNVNSGYYEHPELLKIYGQIRKHNRLSRLSDNLAEHFRAKAVHSLRQLLGRVQAIKYPPISKHLPYLIDRAGYEPVLAISARHFEPYAISRTRMEGIGYNECKEDYLDTYQTALLLLKIYKGVVVDYEGLIRNEGERAEEKLATLSGADRDLVRHVIRSNVKQARSHGETEDEECRFLYERLVSFSYE